jgi:LysM repeat protein
LFNESTYGKEEYQMTKASVTRKAVLILAVILMMQLFIGSAANAAPPESGSCFYYTVSWGDSLSSIAFTYGDNVWNLAARNGIANPNFIRAGQVLYVCGWGGGWAPPPGVTYHTVQWGQTLWSIANWYGTTPWAIASMNGLYNMNLIYAGQVLRVR